MKVLRCHNRPGQRLISIWLMHASTIVEMFTHNTPVVMILQDYFVCFSTSMSHGTVWYLYVRRKLQPDDTNLSV